MLRLSQSDWGLVLDFLGKIQSCRSAEMFAHRVVTLLAEILPARQVTWNYLAPSVRAAWKVATPPNESKSGRAGALTGRATGLRVPPQRLDAAAPELSAVSDFWSKREFRQTPIYRRLYRGRRMEDQMGFWLSRRRREMVGIGFIRDTPNFTQRERTLLMVLRPHLAQRWRNILAFSWMRRLALLRRHAHAQLGQTVVPLDLRGRVVRLPGRARRWLAEFFGEPHSVRAPLPVALTHWLAERFVGAEDIADNSAAGAQFIQDCEGRRLTARVFRLASGGLLVLEKLNLPPGTPGVERFGLTPREGAVLREVGKGRTNKEIAAILGISPLTARKHLENIFDKLGVTNRTAAIRIVEK